MTNHSTGARAAVITGSTSGVGLAIADALAALGVNLLLNGLESPEEAAHLVEKLARKHSVRVVYSPANMTKRAQIREMIALADLEFGGVDILVNNAGIQHVAAIDELPDESWDAIIAVNLSAYFHAIKAVIPGMRDRQHGRIINIASTHGLIATPFKGAYAAAKHGVVGLTKAAALELATAGITVNAICPGFVRTALVEQQIQNVARQREISPEDAAEQAFLNKHPTRRFVEASDVAAMAVYLASDVARSITGATQTIDGGWTAT